MRIHRVPLIALIIVSGWGGSSARQNSLTRSHATQAIYKFDFGPVKIAQGHTQVLANTIYSKDLAYGFEPGARVTCLDRGGKDALHSDFCTSNEPFYFSVALPEGNYNVMVTLGDAQQETSTTIKAELRRLML